MSDSIKSTQHYLDRYNLPQNNPVDQGPAYPSKSLEQPGVDPDFDTGFGSYEDFENYSMDFEGADSEFGSDFAVGDATYQEPTGTQALSKPAALEMTQDFFAHLRGSDKIGSERQALADQIKAIMDQLNQVSGSEVPPEVANQLFALQANLLGTGPGTVDPSAADDPFGLDEVLGQSKEGPDKLLSNLKEFKDTVQKNTNLSSEDKQTFLEKLDRWISNMELTPGEEEIQQIDYDFSDLKGQFTQASHYGPVINRVAQATGNDPAQVEELFEKHGIDPKNLPSPPNGKIADLLNDSDFSGSLNSLMGEAKEKYKSLKDEIKTQVSNANLENEKNQASDTSQRDSVDQSSFKFLYNANFHRDDFSEALINTRLKAAEETASLLSALYGEEVSASTDPEKAGIISFKGSELNILSKGGISEISFSQTEPEWPPVEMVEIFIDNEADGKTDLIDWMKEAHYPYYNYDWDNSASGAWTYQGDRNDGSLKPGEDPVDIGREV